MNIKNYLIEHKRILLGQLGWLIAITIPMFIYMRVRNLPHELVNSLFTVGFMFIMVAVLRYFKVDGFLDFSKYTFKTQEQLEFEKIEKEKKANSKTAIKSDFPKIIWEKFIIGIIAVLVSLILTLFN